MLSVVYLDAFQPAASVELACVLYNLGQFQTM
jgi:hypothetical protein